LCFYKINTVADTGIGSEKKIGDNRAGKYTFAAGIALIGIVNDCE
jgi:hypothetical protein